MNSITEVALRPIEEQRAQADIRESELQQRPELPQPPEPVSQVAEPVSGREEGVRPAAEQNLPHLGGEPALEPGRRDVVGGEGALQPELERVQGVLERKLPRRERKAFQPEVEALRRAPQYPTNPTFIQTYRFWSRSVPF